MKETHARLRELAASSLELKSDDLLTDEAPRSADLDKIRQTESVSQTSQVETNKNGQNFETIKEPHKSMLRLIDTMFDNFQLIADEINKENADPQLNVHWQRPTLEKIKSTVSWLKKDPELPSFTGKIYTFDWSLIIKGTSELITSYVIPSDRVISFNTEPEIYSPYLTINYVKKGANGNWQIANEVITQEHIPELTKKLLERLLKSARSKEWSQSVFCLQRASAEDHKPNMYEGADLPTNPNGGVGDPEQLLFDLMQNASEKTKRIEGPNQAPSGWSKAIDVPSQGVSEKVNGIETPNLTAPDAITQSSNIIDYKSNFEENRSPSLLTASTFEEAIRSLPDLIAFKLEVLTKEGGEAFNKRDLKGAQDILILSNQLNEFRIKVEEIMAAFTILR